jgi:hypothetical protein
VDDLLRLVAVVDGDVAVRGNAADAKPRMPEFDPLVRGRCDRLSRMVQPFSALGEMNSRKADRVSPALARAA